MAFQRAAKQSDVPPGQGISLRLGPHRVAIFNVDGTFHATDDACLHAGGPLGEGPLRGSVVTCPWHGWEFDVVKGCAVMSDDVTIPKYEVKVKGDSIYVNLPEAHHA